VLQVIIHLLQLKVHAQLMTQDIILHNKEEILHLTYARLGSIVNRVQKEAYISHAHLDMHQLLLPEVR